MDEMTFIDKIRKIIKMRHDDIVSSMASGGVDNMEKYQYMLGQIRTYQYLNQEISTLLNKKEQNDKDGTVININSKTEIELPNKELVGVKPTEKKIQQNSLNLPVGEF